MHSDPRINPAECSHYRHKTLSSKIPKDTTGVLKLAHSLVLKIQICITLVETNIATCVRFTWATWKRPSASSLSPVLGFHQRARNGDFESREGKYLILEVLSQEMF